MFDGISEKDVISWTCMIDVYGRNGQGGEAVEVFQVQGGRILYPS